MGWRIVVGCHGFVYGILGGKWRLLAVSRYAGFIYDVRKGRKMSCVRGRVSGYWRLRCDCFTEGLWSVRVKQVGAYLG